MRYLTFGPDDSQLFIIAHAAVLGSEPPRTAGDTRLVGKLLDKLEAMGMPEPGETLHFQMQPTGGTLALEDAEFTKFAAMVESAGIKAFLARKKIELIDRIAAAPAKAPELTA